MAHPMKSGRLAPSETWRRRFCAGIGSGLVIVHKSFEYFESFGSLAKHLYLQCATNWRTSCYRSDFKAGFGLIVHMLLPLRSGKQAEVTDMVEAPIKIVAQSPGAEATSWLSSFCPMASGVRQKSSICLRPAANCNWSEPANCLKRSIWKCATRPIAANAAGRSLRTSASSSSRRFRGSCARRRSRDAPGAASARRLKISVSARGDDVVERSANAMSSPANRKRITAP